MPTRFAALAGGLLASLPILLSHSAAQEPLPWQRGAEPRYQQRNEGYRQQEPARGYDDPDADDQGGNVPRRGAPSPGNRNDAYQPRYGAPAPPPGGDTHSPRYAAPRAPVDDAYRPPQHGQPQPGDAYSPRRDAYGAPPSSPGRPYGQPYTPPPGAYDDPRERRYGAYDQGPRDPDARYDEPRDGSYSSREILDTGHRFFGTVSKGLASVVEFAFRKQGRPNGYILGQEAGGALFAGLRYGEGMLYTKDAGTHRVYWQGPSIGYDAGAEGSKVMVLIYNLHFPEEIYQRFAGVDGSAYLVGGVGVTFLTSRDLIVAPIRSGVGLRFGANVGYLKYTRWPTWNPF
jgi:hypothetical protein